MSGVRARRWSSRQHEKLDDGDLRNLCEEGFSDTFESQQRIETKVDHVIESIGSLHLHNLTSEKAKDDAAERQPDRHAIKIIGDISYICTEKLGDGSKGTTVYKGQFSEHDVAVKVGKKDVITGTEIKMLMQFRKHENIVEYYHSESDVEYYYLAFQLCLTSLENFIKNEEKREAILRDFVVSKKEILHGAIRGLNHLHNEHNIVHRDVKPSNILIVQRNSGSMQIKAVISDFGIATELEPDRYSQTTIGLKGTLMWLAPELVNKTVKKFSKAVDIFSMGCVMYYVLSDGHHPFGNDIVAIIQNFGTHSYTLDDISDEVKDRETAKHLIKQMIHKDKDLRISVEEVLNHCYFWSNERQLDFLEAASDILEFMPSTKDHMIEHGAADVIGTNWMNQIDATDIPGNYDPTLVKDLLRAIKAKKHSAGIVSVSSVTHRFPMLLMHVYNQMKYYDKTLSYYYQSDAGDMRNLQNLQNLTLIQQLECSKQELAAEKEKYHRLLRRKEIEEAEKEQEVQRYRDQLNEKYREIAEKDQEIRHYSHQLQEKEAQREQEKQEYDHQIQKYSRQMQQKDEENVAKEQKLRDYESQFKIMKTKIEDMDKELLQSQELFSMQQQEDEHWVINEDEVTLTTDEELGRGSYAIVKVGIFRGIRVAVKSLHYLIISSYNRRHFSREMSIASRVRHPNLVQFIGATIVGNPLILTELMSTSLYKMLQEKELTKQQILSIAQDVALGLNYLHLFQPQPIIHRDVSSANILLKPCTGPGGYEAKITDYGTAKLQQSTSTGTVMPGNPAYAAPEARDPEQHSPAMDVYSYSVLLMEMNLHSSPAYTIAERARESGSVSWSDMKSLIQRGLTADPRARPTMAQVIEALKGMKI
uniref:Protein kinase domain-containing protein n=1 Tax=Amphimedon queenslandica TaxID=400682 RepID=A0A1X7UFH5_AMPQE